MKIEFSEEKLKRKSVCNSGGRIFIESNKKLIEKNFTNRMSQGEDRILGLYNKVTELEHSMTRKN